MADYSELKRKAQEIKDEVKAGANTANRVGLALEEAVNALEAENKRAEQAEQDLQDAIQLLQDDTEDLQSIRDEVERLGNEKADKSALEATNDEVSKKQNKLEFYKEDPSNGSVEIFAQDVVSIQNDSQGGVSCVKVYNEEDTAEGLIPVARMSAGKENGDSASVTVRGNEVHIDGDAVKVNGVDLENVGVTIVNDLTTGGADKALSAEMGKELGKEATTEHKGLMSAEDKKRLNKSEYTVEIGSINYLTGKEASSTKNVRTENIPITGAGSIELLTSIDTPYVQMYVIQYLNGVYVGYTKDLKLEPTNYDSIRIRIDYTNDVDENFAKNLTVKILGNNTICGEVLENNYVSAEANQFFSTQIQLPNPGFINISDGSTSSDSTYATSDYIKVFPGQIIGITLAARGNAGVVGYSSESNDGFLPIVQIPNTTALLERKVFVTIPENINYIRISSAISITPVAKIDYVRSINYEFLNKLIAQQKDLTDNPLLIEKIPFQLNHYFNLATGKFSAADSIRSSDYIKVYPGQQLDVTFAGYGNCGIAGFVKKEDIQYKEPVKGYRVLLKLPSPAKEGTYRLIIPENINYIKISSVVNITPEGTIDYSSSVNYDFLNKILNNYDFNGLVELVIHKLNCSAINNDYQGFRLNHSIPDDDDKLYLSTDIYNIATRSNPTTNELVKAFAPMLFYKMQKVGCFVLYDVENNNRPFIYDIDGNKKYITLTDN